MDRPRFSIITASLNQGTCLRGAIESVLAQRNCGEIEHIIVEGGSTDETDALLQEYPHLTIVRSEFVSLSQALNQGFAVATGEIVSWLNPSDRFAPGAFECVASEMARHPVVMGACGICDERGAVESRVENIERSWFDTLKYWVANAIPTQPAVFFSRDLLSDLKIEPSDVFDESLHFAMDFDLWLRIQEVYPFSLRTSQILAHRPRREMVPCASSAAALQAEMSRVFRRHATRRIQPEQNLSFILPVTTSVVDLQPMLDQLSAQTLPSLEVVIVDSSGSLQHNREMAERVWAHNAKNRSVTLQYVALSADGGHSRAAAVDAGVRAARSPIVAYLSPSRKLPEHFAADVFRCFSRDEIGLVLPSLDQELVDKLFVSKHGTRIFNPSGPFSLPSEPRLEYVARKLAWIDSGGFALHDRFPECEFSMKRLMVMLAHKAWRIVSEPLLESLKSDAASQETPFRLYENSVVVDELARELRRNPFSIMRANHGFGLVLPDDLWQSAQLVMRRMPEDPTIIRPQLPSEKLRAVADMNPVYGPALFCLAEALTREGKLEDANRVRSKWREVHEGEKSSPLYGGVSH
jgi:hypothetical protein